jgi:hypothetical protein
MPYEIGIKLWREITAAGRPFVTSYDSGYEHSLEHWIDLQRRVEEAAASPGVSADLQPRPNIPSLR